MEAWWKGWAATFCVDAVQNSLENDPLYRQLHQEVSKHIEFAHLTLFYLTLAWGLLEKIEAEGCCGEATRAGETDANAHCQRDGGARTDCPSTVREMANSTMIVKLWVTDSFNAQSSPEKMKKKQSWACTREFCWLAKLLNISGVRTRTAGRRTRILFFVRSVDKNVFFQEFVVVVSGRWRKMKDVEWQARIAENYFLPKRRDGTRENLA